MTKDLVVVGRQRAVAYLRMSREHQKYSLEIQRVAIADYAAEKKIDIIDSYVDSGRSGLTLRERKELNRLLRDVTNPSRMFSTILVLDVSRWGRFQDPDQHAAYEFFCRDMGVQVQYVSESFANDGSISSSILKHLKRVMAGEYSRELSAKVSRGIENSTSKGFKAGGSAIYGFRRLALDSRGQPRGLLAPGEMKFLLTDKVILVPGPAEEIRVIRRIFKLFTRERVSIMTIVRILNGENISCGTERANWSYQRVHTILTSELMVGTYVYNRTSQKLKTKVVKNPESLWIKRHILRPIIGFERFELVQGLLRNRDHSYSKSKMLDALRDLLRQEGMLSSSIIKSSMNVPAEATYCKHFGSLQNAFKAIGYEPGSACVKIPIRSISGTIWTREKLLDALRALLNEKGKLSSELVKACPYTASPGTYVYWFGGVGNACREIGYFSGRTQRISQRPRRKMAPEAALAGVRRLHDQYGFISARLIGDDPALPSVNWFKRRFGNLMAVYRAAGLSYTRGEILSMARQRILGRFRKGAFGYNCPPSQSVKTATVDELINGVRRLHASHGYISGKLIEEDPQLPGLSIIYRQYASLLHLYARAGFPYSKAELSALARNPKLRDSSKRPLDER